MTQPDERSQLSLVEFARLVIDALEAAETEYMLAGALAVAAWAEARSTLDVDIETRVDLPVNVIHMYSGYKADLFLLRPGDEYRETAFFRHFRSILLASGDELDMDYIESWARRLGLSSLWEELR